MRGRLISEATTLNGGGVGAPPPPPGQTSWRRTDDPADSAYLHVAIVTQARYDRPS